MKKMMSLLIVMALLCAVAMPIAAADFVPSISYKDHPDVIGDPEIVFPADPTKELDILVTPVSEAINTDPADRNEAEQALVALYEALTDGETEPPYPDDDKNYVIRDLVDISLIVKNNDPNAEPEFVDGDAQVEITFDLGVKGDTEVLVYVYQDDEWKPVTAVVNNGDGTVTVAFDNLGAVAFCVEDETSRPPSGTFDKMNLELTTWIVLMVLSSCALIVMLALRRKVRR